MNTAKQLWRAEPARPESLTSTQLRYLQGGPLPLITEETFSDKPTTKRRRRSLGRRMLSAFTSGRRCSGRPRSPRYGF